MGNKHCRLVYYNIRSLYYRLSSIKCELCCCDPTDVDGSYIAYDSNNITHDSNNITHDSDADSSNIIVNSMPQHDAQEMTYVPQRYAEQLLSRNVR